MLRNLRELGKTVLLTSHYMDEVEHVADRAAVMISGKIVSEGTPQELAHETEPTICFSADKNLTFPVELVADVNQDDDRYELSSPDIVKTLHVLTGWAIENSVELENLSISRGSLDDAFVKLTQTSEEKSED